MASQGGLNIQRNFWALLSEIQETNAAWEVVPPSEIPSQVNRLHNLLHNIARQFLEDCIRLHNEILPVLKHDIGLLLAIQNRAFHRETSGCEASVRVVLNTVDIDFLLHNVAERAREFQCEFQNLLEHVREHSFTDAGVLESFMHSGYHALDGTDVSNIQTPRLRKFWGGSAPHAYGWQATLFQGARLMPSLMNPLREAMNGRTTERSVAIMTNVETLHCSMTNLSMAFMNLNVGLWEARRFSRLPMEGSV